MRILIIISFCFLFFTCKKNKLGGSAEVTGVVKHHSKIIGNATVYIKLKAKEFPGEDVNNYDDKVTADANGNFKFTMYKGNYYIYAVGVDNQVIINNGKVIGGVPVNLRNNEKISIIVPVTEGD